MLSPEQARIAGRLSIAYMMAVAGEVLRRYPFDMLDLLLVTAIADLNLAAAKDCEPAPERAGVSRNAVSRAVNVPLETVRRRIAGLIDKKVLCERPDGIVFVPANSTGLGNDSRLSELNIALLRELFRDLKRHGIDLD
jgi:hypothetical protein